ncbi:hypothetical protein VNI00_009999 [Paramarasmius palmivorus]|uniref:Importin N-terminal domain-containing protein n=1 Tax=Paramarasmius palmivorus TaxID=297713 RepID=A0AAW0CK42_9AGAR
MSSPSNIAECLSSTLSSDPNVRMAAELKLAELMAFPETGLALSQLIVTQEADETRLDDWFSKHSASIVLRKYVRERWSVFFPTFKGNAPPVEIKSQIRQAVFHGLSDPARKIRSSCAHALSSIANCDWPEEYPDLLTSLINLISSNSPASVHGAMQVFAEFINNDLTEDQILPVLRDLLPVLLNILGSTETQSPFTRARTVSVFRQCVISLFMVKEQHPQAVKEAIASVLPVWLEAFKVLLNLDPKQDISGPSWDNLAVRIQVFKSLPYLNELLAAALNHLVIVYPTFDQCYISASEPIPSSSEDEPVELPQLITSTMDFVSAIARGGRAREWFDGERSATLVSAVFDYIQMTEDDEETWGSNANAFVAQEDDDLASYSVRVAGLDLLNVLMDRNVVQTTAICHNVMQRVVSSSDQARNAGKRDWWRPLEAALTAVGSQADTIQDCIEDEQDSGRSKPIDIESLLANVVPSILGQAEFPFLQGRGFVFASQYAKLLPVQLAGQYLNAAVQVIEADNAGIPIKVSAVKAVHNFCVGSDDSALTPFIPRIAKDLGPFLLATSEDTLSLVLETLSVVLEVDEGKWLTADLATSLVMATLEVWTKNNKGKSSHDRPNNPFKSSCMIVDPIFLSIFPDILQSLAASKAPGLYQAVAKQALPSLVMSMTEATQDQSYITSSAIELVSSLIRASSDGLGDGFFELLAPILFKCLIEAEDRDVLQNGITCITLVVRKDCAQLLNYNDGSQSGLDHVLRLVAKILQGDDESAGLTMGELIIHLLRRAGDRVLPVLPELLHAMVTLPTEFTSIPFPVKAIKILLHEVQSGGESATMGAAQEDTVDVESDDGDEDWADTGDSARKDSEFEFLSELIGPKGMAFDNDDIWTTTMTRI